MNGGDVKTGAEFVRRQLEYPPNAPHGSNAGRILNDCVEGDYASQQVHSDQFDGAGKIFRYRCPALDVSFVQYCRDCGEADQRHG